MKIKKKIRKFIYTILKKIYPILKDVELKYEQNKVLNTIKNIAICGDNLHINGSIYISNPKNLLLGTNVHIGNNAYFNTEGGLIIGDNVHFSRNVTIYTSSHNYEGAIPYDNHLITKQVIIKENAWIGMNVNITPGVTIGEGAIIGLGTTVSKDVPDFAIVGNEPFRILKHRDNNLYFKHLSNNNIGGTNGNILDVDKLEKVSGKELGENLFFIVSTGRSGTTSLAAILSQHPQIETRHEITDILVRISTQWEHGQIDKEKVLMLLKSIYCDLKIFPKGKVFGESNQKISNLIPLLHELLPKAKFIWLIRNGKDVVNSTFTRGWYSKSETDSSLLRNPAILSWKNYRVQGDLTSDYSKQEWNAMDAFSKNCWYWVKWNQIIENNLETIPNNNKMLIKLENFSNNLEQVLTFLNLNSSYNFNVLKLNKSQEKLKSIDNWNPDQTDKYNRICSDFENKYYK